MAEQQLANPDFDNHFDPTPYQEYDPEGHQIYSNLMSGQWAFREAVSFIPSLSVAIQHYH